MDHAALKIQNQQKNSHLFKYCCKGQDCAYIKLLNMSFDEDNENQQNVSEHDRIKQY